LNINLFGYVLGFWGFGFLAARQKNLKNQDTKMRKKTDNKQKEQKMQNEFSVLAPEQERKLKDTFIVMMNMQHYSQKNQKLYKFKFFNSIISYFLIQNA